MERAAVAYNVRVVTYYPTQEIMRYTNEIGRMTNQPAPSFMAGKKVILECAALKFQACRENKAAAYTEFVRRKVEQEFESGKVSMGEKRGESKSLAVREPCRSRNGILQKFGYPR